MTRVRFQEDDTLCTVVCEITALSELSEEELSNTWYVKSDYVTFRHQAKVISGELRRQRRGLLLEGAVEDDFPKPEGTSNAEIQTMLVLWSRQGFSSRGLERRVNLNHGKLRKDLQRRSIQIVIEVQQREQRNYTPTDALEEKIRTAYTNMADPIRTFAHRMGIADAAAVLLERHSCARQSRLSAGQSQNTLDANRRSTALQVSTFSQVA